MPSGKLKPVTPEHARFVVSKADAENIMLAVLLSGRIPHVVQQFMCGVLRSEVMLDGLVLETMTSLQTRDSQKEHANSSQEG